VCVSVWAEYYPKKISNHDRDIKMLRTSTSASSQKMSKLRNEQRPNINNHVIKRTNTTFSRPLLQSQLRVQRTSCLCRRLT
jgi:hypothetical protein